MKLPTERQKEILDIIIEETIEHQRIMTFRDVANRLDVTPKAVTDAVTALRGKGLIYKQTNFGKAGIYPKGIEIVRKKVKASEL